MSEIINLFKFLSNQNSDKIDKGSTETILFSLDNYFNNIPQATKDKIKNDINYYSDDNVIQLEDFKNLWITNMNFDLSNSIKDSTNQIFSLMQDYLHKDKFNKKINNEEIEKLLLQLDVKIQIDTNEFNEFVESKKNDKSEKIPPKKRKEYEKEFVDIKRKEIAIEMVQCIDLDEDNLVSPEDLEYLISDYLKS